MSGSYVCVLECMYARTRVPLYASICGVLMFLFLLWGASKMITFMLRHAHIFTLHRDLNSKCAQTDANAPKYDRNRTSSTIIIIFGHCASVCMREIIMSASWPKILSCNKSEMRAGREK